MRHSLPLPFPVRDTSGLKRAIKFVLRAASIDEDAQRYVIGRARLLGHTDLLPTSWTQMTTAQYDVTLDEQIEQLAQNNGISVAQLKTVYLRGVNDFLESQITYGSATMYGLARAQRFINERGSVVDGDLVETDDHTTELDHGIELSAGMFFSPDIVYASGQQVAALFAPGVVTSIALHDDSLRVNGELGALKWSYVLETVSGVECFTVIQ